MKSTISRITLFLMVSFALGQSVWDQGDFGITYGSPFPNQTWDVSGSFLNTGIPAEGVGGFEVALGDTSMLVLMAYETYTQGADTLADAFLVVMQSSGAIVPGNYTVSVVPGELRLFAWLQEMDPEVIAGLLADSLDFSTLAELNPYLSVSGAITIESIGFSGLSLSFSGMLINTNLAFISIAAGSFDLQNTLPLPGYALGTLNYTENTDSGVISGELNPLLSNDGVGALHTSAGDTTRYTILAYADQGGNLYDIFAVDIVGATDLLNVSGFDVTLPLTIDPAVYPRATPIVAHDVDLEVLLSILQSGAVSELEVLNDVYVPVGAGESQFTLNDADQLNLTYTNLFMANLSGSTMLLGQDWFIANQWPLSILGDAPLNLPAATLLVGTPYPNPFNSSTVLPIELAQSQNLELIVYNILGQEKIRLDLGYFPAGKHLQGIDLNGYGLSGGLYHFAIAPGSTPPVFGSFIYLK